MKFWFAILCFSVAGLHPDLARPGERNPVETDLRRSYEGKLLSLKHPCAGRKLEFDPQGKCLTTCEEVPWTTGGLLPVKQLDVKSGRLEIKGNGVPPNCAAILNLQSMKPSRSPGSCHPFLFFPSAVTTIDSVYAFQQSL